MLTPAPLETTRFGLRTFRGTLGVIDTRALFDCLAAENVDLAILRVPPNQAPAVAALEHYGLTPIHADTLVGYTCNLRDIPPPPPTSENGFLIDDARDDDAAAISELVDIVFAEYPSHYTANPLLDAHDVVAGYREWALSHLRGANRVAWVARVDGHVAAIACSAFDPSSRECQGVLHGVHPDFSRGGIYTALIRHTQSFFRELGCERLTIQTQAWNMPVQRVWAREGFALAEVFETFHVNALFNSRHDGAGSAEIIFRSTMPQDVASEVLGVLRRIAVDKGMQVSSSRVATNTTVFEPLAPGVPYSLFVRSYCTRAGHEVVLAAGTLRDPGDRICAVARVTARLHP